MLRCPVHQPHTKCASIHDASVTTGLTVSAQWDRTNPDDRYSWGAQHEVLKFMDPPYVYNVFRDDKTGFVDAIRSALRTPIQGYECCSCCFWSVR